MGSIWAKAHRLASLWGELWTRNDGEGADEHQLTEKVVDWGNKCAGWCEQEDNWQNRAEGSHAKGMHPNKQVPTWQCKEGNSNTSSREPTELDTSLKCLHTNTRGMGRTQKELEVCVLLQGYDLIGITGERWMVKRSVGRTGWCIKGEPSRNAELCLWMDEESGESLWVRISGQTNVSLGQKTWWQRTRKRPRYSIPSSLSFYI